MSIGSTGGQMEPRETRRCHGADLLCRRCALLAVAAHLALGGCGRAGIDVPGSAELGPLADGMSTGDLSGTVLHLSWAIVFNGKPATCAEAGVARVGLRDWRDGAPRRQWECSAGQSVTDPLDGFSPAVVALDAVGLPLGYVFLNDPKYGAAGDVDAPVVLHVTDEPGPQLRTLFGLVADWYGAHGTLPAAAGWSQGPPGICCNGLHYVCANDRVEVRAQPWRDLGFLIGHESHFGYSWEVVSTSPPRFTVLAGADLNCDVRTFSSYRLTGVWNGQAFEGIDNLQISNPGE